MKFKNTNKIPQNKVWTKSLKGWVRINKRTEWKGIVHIMIEFDKSHIVCRHS